MFNVIENGLSPTVKRNKHCTKLGVQYELNHVKEKKQQRRSEDDTLTFY